jgi:hypothetical protein
MPNDLYSLFQQYQNQQYNEPTEGVVTAIDGQFVDVYIRANASKLRNVFCTSDTDNMYVGQTVGLVWTRHVPTASARVSGASAGSSFTADGSSLEAVGGVLRVRRGGIQTWHLAFKPSMEGHTHLDSLQKSGWMVDGDGVIQKDNVFIHPDGQISLGQSPDLLKLDAAHATHRFWIGDTDPALADFAVSKEGAMTARAGTIAGWDILANRLSKNNIDISSDGEITVGSGDDVAMLSSIDTNDWRFWIGNANPASAPFRVDKFGKAWISGAVINGDMQSANFSSGLSGWHIDDEGWAEFNDVLIRGKIKSSIFARTTTSVVAGRQIVAEGAVLMSDVGISDMSIDVDDAAFVENELVRLSVDGRTEWMRVTSAATDIGTGFRYTVERGLDGDPELFYAGETVFSGGVASLPETPSSFGEADRGWGAVPFGAGSYTTSGGFLTLDGSREYGPYFGAAIRYGADYRQVRDMLRMGNLSSFLDGMFPDDFGLAVGDTSRYFAYTFRTGLSIKTDAGKTSVDDRGILSERFGLLHTNTPPDYLAGYTRFYIDPTTKAMRARSSFGGATYDVAIADLESGGAGGVSDHGLLTGLADDDHTQYHTDARGDARYSQLGHTHSEYLLSSGLSEWDEQTSTPALPAPGKHKVYFKDDGKPYVLDSAGVEGEIGAGAAGGSSGGVVLHHDQSGGTSDTYGALAGTIDGSNKTFTTSEGQYMSGSLQVFLNGQLLIQGTSEAWIETDPSTGAFELNDAPVAGDELFVSYLTTGSVIGSGDRTDQSGGTSDTYGVLAGDIDGVNTTFTASAGKYVSGALHVYLNGQLQTQGDAEDWVETSPSVGTFDFNTPPVPGDEITIKYKVHGAGAGNADTLDGYHADAFASTDHNHDSEYAAIDHAHDAAEVTYTPSSIGGSWNGADPGNTDAALDNLANRNIPKAVGLLDDDTVYSFAPPNSFGVLVVQSRTNFTKGIDSLVLFRVGASAFANALTLGPDAILTTGTLTNGTTNGTDGKFNISVHTDGSIYLKNRTGAGVYFNYYILSSV